jgi:NAD(P)-dependent dehydrogenase (short-subunit alcohol dehydrogenase family)
MTQLPAPGNSERLPDTQDRLDPRPLFDVTGRVIIVTGATRGLGAAMAEGLAACGARVVVVGRSRADAESVVARIAARGDTAIPCSADVATEEGPALIVEAAVSAFGGIDVLVNNAGILRPVPVEHLSRSDYREVHGVNAEAALFLCQAALPHLRSSQRGSVVNIVSVGLWTDGPNSILYRSSKAALHAMTMVLAQEWGPYGVRVNAIAPGLIAAGMGAKVPGDRAAVALSRTPLGRPGNAEEIVPAVLYLASNASSYVTGETLRIDGGRVSL